MKKEAKYYLSDVFWNIVLSCFIGGFVALILVLCGVIE